jgi:hypothetical protein
MQQTDALVLALVRELDDITVADRIRQSTDLKVQERIDREFIQRVGRYAESPRHLLTAYLAELEREWSIERVLALQSASTALAGVVLGTLGPRRWLLLAVATSGFLLQHAVQGWCPPLELHRRLGFRTQREIDLEIHMLKLLRGDYAGAAEVASGVAWDAAAAATAGAPQVPPAAAPA